MIRASQTIYIANSRFNFDPNLSPSVTKLFVKRVETSGSTRVLIGTDGKRYAVNGKRLNIFDRWFRTRNKAEAYLKRLASKKVIIISTPSWNPGQLEQLYSRLESRFESSNTYAFVPWTPTQEEWEENELKRKVCELPVNQLIPARNLSTKEVCYLHLSKKATAAINKLRGTGIDYRK